jgi:hypothetical protein
MSNLDLSPLELAIYNWLVPAYVPRAIFSNQRVQMPSFPYASILMTASSREGGRDSEDATTTLTRAKNVRLTPTAHDSTVYTVTINGVAYTHTSGSGATATTITAGLKTAMAAVTAQVVTDNHGTLDIVGAVVFTLVVTANITWANRDYGHEVVFTTTAARRLAYSITVHVDESNMTAGGAYAWAETIRSSLSMESVVKSLLSQNVAIVRDMGVRDISTMLNGQWISRAMFDVVFRTVLNPTEDTGYIATATATGTIDDNLPDEQTVVITLPE